MQRRPLRSFDVVLNDSSCGLRRLHNTAAPLQDSVSDSGTVTASSTLPKTLAGILAESESTEGLGAHKCSAASDALLKSGSVVPEPSGGQPIIQGTSTSQIAVDQPHDRDADSAQLATPPPPTAETSPPPPPTAETSPQTPDDTAAAPPPTTPEDSATLSGPIAGRESAHTFLRDAKRVSKPVHTTSGAGRITAVMRRLGSVPSPQVKADLTTFRDTVLDLLTIASAAPRVDVGRFLLAYSRSITRHPRLLSALKADSRYLGLLHRLIFIPVQPSAATADDISATLPPTAAAADGEVWTHPAEEGGLAADGRGPSHGAATVNVEAQLPRAFEIPESFPMALTAMLRLRLCPPAFWNALVCWGIPYVPNPEPSADSVDPSAEALEGETGDPAAHDAAAAAKRPEWQQRNAAIAISLTELMALRYSEETPSEGLDARRRPQRSADRPALPPPGARHDVESFAASLVPLMTTEEVARTLYHFGQTRAAPRPDVLCVLEEAAIRQSGGMPVKHLALLLGGYAGMRVRPGPLLEGVLSRRIDKVATAISIHALHVMLLQTAKLGATLPEETYVSLVRRMRDLLAGGTFEAAKFAPRLLWACAVYTAVHGAGFGRRAGAGAAAWELLEAYAGLWEAGRVGCDADATTLLRQAHHSIEVLGKEHNWQIEEGTAVRRFALHCQRVAREYAARQVEVATIHGPRQRVLRSLKQLCAESSNCIVTTKAVWGGDAHFSYITVSCGDRWVSVEVEVPSNVVHNASGEATGVSAKPLLRNWALRHWGGEVVSIVEDEWDDTSLSSREFLEGLRAELQARGLPV